MTSSWYEMDSALRDVHVSKLARPEVVVFCGILQIFEWCFSSTTSMTLFFSIVSSALFTQYM